LDIAGIDLHQKFIVKYDIPLIHTYRIVRRNSKNKMATLLHFVNGCSHIAVQVQRMTLSFNQS